MCPYRVVCCKSDSSGLVFQPLPVRFPIAGSLQIEHLRFLGKAVDERVCHGVVMKGLDNTGACLGQ